MKSLKLWYNYPVNIWEESLPIGNGRLGGMVFGKIQSETIHINEDTLWSGYPKDTNNYQALSHLENVRELIFNKQYAKAQSEIKEHMLCDFNQSYQPLANLNINLLHDVGKVSDFKRELNLQNAICKTSYCCDNVKFERTSFASAKDNSIVCHFAADSLGKISVCASMDSLLEYNVSAKDNSILILKGRCPSHTDPNYLTSENPIIYDDIESNRAMTFESRLVVRQTGGTSYLKDDSIIIEDADAVTFLLVANTSYNGYDKFPSINEKDPSILCQKNISNLIDKSYDQMIEDHIKDYTALFNRVSLKLATTKFSDLPTNERLIACSNGEYDPDLVALLFNFGRYLMISSSRPGTQPANLQGIWNSELRPPWSSNLTANINAEMNYWPVETCNLSECHTPLLDMIGELKENGTKTAKIHYGCNGWVSHHNVDIWRQSTPVGKLEEGNYSPTYGFWPMGGAWFCRHLFEHYLFTMDTNFLREKAYPIMKDSAVFFCDWLIDDKNGGLTTCPSTSPENTFITESGDACAVSSGSTMDLSIIKDLFQSCIQASELLNVDKEFRLELKKKLARINPFRIGKYGQLQEWNEDFEEKEIHHRHISHLYGLYPAALISPASTPDLAKAAISTLNRRGDAGTGWSLAWKVNLWARLKDGNRALSLIKQQLEPVLRTDINYTNGGGTYPNMFGAHPPFQIDSNFGVTSGIAEMLMQSHNEVIEILPALPDEWDSVSIKGLKARGCFEVDITWSERLPQNISVKSLTDNTLLLKYKDKTIKMATQKDCTYTFNQKDILM